jgi:ABC-type Fe3+ transport system permease subunit
MDSRARLFGRARFFRRQTRLFIQTGMRYTAKEGGGGVNWFPLWNSLRIAAISTGITFFLGLFAAQRITAAPRWLKGALDTLLTLPLVLPPTVIGFFILTILGRRGRWAL